MITRYSRKFERAVRRGVKAEIRKSAALKREYRRVRKATINRSVGSVGIVAIGAILPLFVFMVTNSTRHVSTALAVINVWVLAWAFLQVNTLAATLCQSKDTGALFFMPVSDAFIFKWNAQKFFVRSACWCFPPLLFGYWACAGWVGSWSAVAIAVIAAALSWASLTSLTLFVLTRLRWVPFQLVSFAIVMFPVLLVFGQKTITPTVLEFLDEHAQSLNILLPSGWIPAVYEVATGKQASLTWGLLVPTLVLIASVKSSLRYLQSYYVLREEEHAEPADILPEEIAEEDAIPEEPRARRRLGETAIEEIVLSGASLRGMQSPGDGVVEKQIWRALSERERRLTEFIFPTGFAATQRWMRLFRNLAICAALAVALNLLGARMGVWAAVLGILFTGGQCLKLFGNSGRAFMFSLSGGLRVPMHALFGVGYHEVGRLLLKVTLVQLPLCVAWCLTGGALLAYTFQWPVLTMLALALKVPFMFLAIRIVLLVIGFSSQSNDTVLRLRTIVMIVPIIALVLMIGGLGIATFAASSWWSVAACFCTVLFAYGFYRTYGLWYNRNGFDLLAVQQA